VSATISTPAANAIATISRSGDPNTLVLSSTAVRRSSWVSSTVSPVAARRLRTAPGVPVPTRIALVLPGAPSWVSTVRWVANTYPVMKPAWRVIPTTR
jgi:hypothetical protein